MSNKITLAFDTCLDKMYVTLMRGDFILESYIVENHDEKYHSAFLISTIKKILKNNNLRPNDIKLIAVNVGPGSFTGIRACTTVARIMAQQIGCKVVGVSSLEIISKLEENPIVALDARKNKAYLYYNNEIKGAVEIEKVKEISKNKKIITDNKLTDIIGGKSYQDTDKSLGDILAKIAVEKSVTMDGDWRRLKPLYIQPPPMG